MSRDDLWAELDGMDYPIHSVGDAASALVIVANDHAGTTTGRALEFIADALQGLANDLSERRERAVKLLDPPTGEVPPPEPEPAPTGGRPTLGLVKGGRREP